MAVQDLPGSATDAAADSRRSTSGTALAKLVEMTGKLLQILGVVLILGLVGGAVAGFGVLKDRVRIVIQDDQVNAGPDAAALLRDDVQLMARDLQGLQQAVASNFEQLATGLENGAENRHQDVRALRQELARVQAELDRDRVSFAQLEARLAGLQQTLLTAVSGAGTAAGSAPPDQAGPGAAASATAGAEQATPGDPPATAAAPPLEPTAPAASAPDPVTAKPKPAGFLSFSLPKSGFAFDQPQLYTLLPELCRVGFDAKSTLHDFTGVTSKVNGSFRADWDDAAGACRGEVLVDATTLQTGVEGRDSNMLEHLDTEHHPEFRFAVTSFRGKAVDVAKQTASGEVVGTMTIRGKSRDLTMPVRIEVDPQQRVVVTGQVKLLLSDYEVPVPSQLGVINMQDEVTVWIALRARAQAEKQ